MKRVIWIVAIKLILGVSGFTASAVPAMPGIRTIVQPDGSTISIRVIGDEFVRFTLTEDGLLLHLDSDGFYRLASFDSNGTVISTGIKPTDVLASKVAVRLSDNDISSIVERRKAAKNVNTVSKRAIAQQGMGLMSNTFPVTGTPKALVILAEYPDVKFQSSDSYNVKEYFNDLINGDNFTQFGATGSAKQYFRDQSQGKFIPQFDIYGPITLPHERKYYGENVEYYGDDKPFYMITDALQILDSDIDFSIYDTDKDGFIDNVYLFYAGQGEADYGPEDSVWPHSADIRTLKQSFDGVTVGHYAVSNEWGKDEPCGIGTFVHEFSHVMGLPDLYTTSTSFTDGGTEFTPKQYSVLDFGPYNNAGRTPPNFGAYERNALGWNDALTTKGPATVKLYDISCGDFLLIPTEKQKEFFLIENRQLTGWDAYIPNHGMLVWHIDYDEFSFKNNKVNNMKGHQYVDIVEANGIPDPDFADGYTFPGTTGKTEFTFTSDPAMKSWAGKEVPYPITNIAEDKNGVLTFDISGGGETLESGIESIGNEATDIPVYYNLQGVRILSPEKGQMLIELSSGKSRKIMF